MITLAVLSFLFMIGCCVLFARFAFKAFTLGLKIMFYLASFAGLGVVVFGFIGFMLVFFATWVLV